MSKTLLAYTMIALGFAATSSWSADDDKLAALQRLITNKQYQQAYSDSLGLIKEYEGDPNFDLLYAFAALETSHASEAIFAFERLLLVNPTLTSARLGLARAAFSTGNYVSARQLFVELLASAPTSTEKTTIQAYIKLIDEAEKRNSGSLTWHLDSSLGSDSNINGATELGIINTPVGDIELSANGRSIDDNFAEFGGGVLYTKPLSKVSAFNLNANYSEHDNFASDDFDLDIISSAGSFMHAIGNNRFSIGGRGQRINLHNRHFQDSVSAITSWQHTTSTGWTQVFTGAYTTILYDADRDKNAQLRDMKQSLISANFSKNTGNFSHSWGGYFGDEIAKNQAGNNNAQQFYGVAFTGQYFLNDSNQPYFRISFHRSENKANDPIFLINRNDNTLSTTLGWRWQASNVINLTTDATYTDNDSNIALYQYERVKFQTGLRFQF
jgi:hypothetical protein